MKPHEPCQHEEYRDYEYDDLVKAWIHRSEGAVRYEHHTSQYGRQRGLPDQAR